MSKKIKNYENDEAFKNFKLEDYLPSMNRRELEQEATQTDEQDVWEGEEQTDGTDIADDKDVEIAPVEADAIMERTIARRVSSKQRRPSLEEYRKTYLQVPKITDRKPVFVNREVRNRLDDIVRRLGGSGMSVSGLVENLAL